MPPSPVGLGELLALPAAAALPPELGTEAVDQEEQRQEEEHHEERLLKLAVGRVCARRRTDGGVGGGHGGGGGGVGGVGGADGASRVVRLSGGGAQGGPLDAIEFGPAAMPAAPAVAPSGR